jgi:hypothetical protein
MTEISKNRPFSSIFSNKMADFSTFVPVYLREKKLYLETEFSFVSHSMSSTE